MFKFWVAFSSPQKVQGEYNLKKNLSPFPIAKFANRDLFSDDVVCPGDLWNIQFLQVSIHLIWMMETPSSYKKVPFLCNPHNRHYYNGLQFTCRNSELAYCTQVFLVELCRPLKMIPAKEAAPVAATNPPPLPVKEEELFTIETVFRPEVTVWPSPPIF